MAAKIIVVSYDNDLKYSVMEGIKGSGMQFEACYNLSGTLRLMSTNNPNVIILDLDSGFGATNFVEMILKNYNLLIILTGKEMSKVHDFMHYGVTDFAIKPDSFTSRDGREFIISITERAQRFLRSGGHQVVSHIPKKHIPRYGGVLASVRNYTTVYGKNNSGTDKLIAIASSTGGPDALFEVLTNLPENMPPILIVQHMPKNFTLQFAKRLDNYCKLSIKEAESGETVYPGTVYIAPGDFHMFLEKSGTGLRVRCAGGNKVNGVRPAADLLFNSVADVMKDKAIGVIMTGMGADGAKGLSIMKNNGSKNIGQDEESCVVYGMPKEAYRLGVLDIVLPLDKIAGELINLCNVNQTLKL